MCLKYCNKITKPLLEKPKILPSCFCQFLDGFNPIVSLLSKTGIEFPPPWRARPSQSLCPSTYLWCQRQGQPQQNPGCSWEWGCGTSPGRLCPTAPAWSGKTENVGEGRKGKGIWKNKTKPPHMKQKEKKGRKLSRQNNASAKRNNVKQMKCKIKRARWKEPCHLFLEAAVFLTGQICPYS